MNAPFPSKGELEGLSLALLILIYRVPDQSGKAWSLGDFSRPGGVWKNKLKNGTSLAFPEFVPYPWIKVSFPPSLLLSFCPSFLSFSSLQLFPIFLSGLCFSEISDFQSTTWTWYFQIPILKVSCIHTVHLSYIYTVGLSLTAFSSHLDASF